MTWYRKNPLGKYVHKCQAGCGVYLKNRMKCYGCVGDLLSDRKPGTWQKDLAEDRARDKKNKNMIVAETRAIYAGMGI